MSSTDLRRVQGILSLMVLVGGLIAAFLRLFPIMVERDIEIALVKPWSGHAYVVPLARYFPPWPIGRLFELPFDTNDRPNASRLRVVEGDASFGMPHAVHVDIAERGGGRFSHWGTDLIFSATDNTDPRRNGRRYRLLYPLVPADWLPTSLIALGALGLLTTLAISLHNEAPTVGRQNALRDIASDSGVACLALGLICAAIYCVPLDRTLQIDTRSEVPRGGHSYVVSDTGYVPSGWAREFFGLDSDSNESPSVSRIHVLENGHRIGVPHSAHAEIAQLGEGRYSHWNGQLIFSASDGTDPTANGRVYAIEYRISPPWWLPWTLLTAGLALLSARPGIVTRSIRDHPAIVFWAFATVLALYLNLALASLFTVPAAAPDSGSYLQGSVYRTWGYPLFLRVYHALFHDWRYLHLFQLDVMLASLFFLAHAVARSTRSYIAAWVLLALPLAGAEMFLSATDILTEAPFAAFVMAHVAAFLLFVHGGDWRLGLFSGLSLASAVLVKSVGIVLVGPVLLMLLVLTQVRRALALYVLASALLAWIIPSAYNYFRHGFFESSAASGYALAGHVAWAIHPIRGSPLETEAAAIERRLAPVLAKRPAFESIGHYVDYTAYEYNTLLWLHIVPEMGSLYSGRCGNDCFITINNALVRLSKEAIAHNPREYAYHVTAHDWGLWRDTFSPGPDLLQRAAARAAWLPQAYSPRENTYLQMLAPLPALKTPKEVYEEEARLESKPLMRLGDLAFARDFLAPKALKWLHANPWALLAASLVASMLIFAARRLSPPALALCYTALCINAYYLGTALAQPSLIRYASVMQGVCAALLATAFAAVAWTARDIAARRRAARSGDD